MDFKSGRVTNSEGNVTLTLA